MYKCIYVSVAVLSSEALSLKLSKKLPFLSFSIVWAMLLRAAHQGARALRAVLPEPRLAGLSRSGDDPYREGQTRQLRSRVKLLAQGSSFARTLTAISPAFKASPSSRG